jgi:hypothetical protein
MTIAVLEQQRARKLLEDFCRQRNALSHVRAQWRLHHEENGFRLSRVEGDRVMDILRLRFAAGRWQLSVPTGDGWEPYPPRPETTDIRCVIDELEQAPLHVHWS